MVTSYNGWPASKDPKAIGINPNWAPLGHKFPGGVKSGDVETVFTELVHRLHAEVEPIDRDAVKDEWGWFYKPSANSPKLISCHSSGTAIDYNATRHPNGHRGTFTAAQVAAIRRILADLPCIHWLGDAKGTPDEMHWEIQGTPADVAAVAARLLNQTPTVQEDDDMVILLTTDGAILLHNGKLALIVEGEGIDSDRQPINQWDLRKAPKTWANLKSAYGPVVH